MLMTTSVTSAAMLAVLLSLSSMPLGPVAGATLALGALMFSAPVAVPVAVTAPAAPAAPVCKSGATKRADDGCNTCSCHDGQWACTEKACRKGGNP